MNYVCTGYSSFTDTIKTIIGPLIKKLCESATKLEDNVICIIAQEFGKLVLGLESKKLLFILYSTFLVRY